MSGVAREAVAEVTKGEWTVDTKAYRAASIPVMAGKKVVAAVRTRFGGFRTTAASEAEGRANARLIAAAKELLEMTRLLEKSLVYQIKKAERIGDEEEARGMSISLRFVRAAIAKATGS